MINTFWCTDIFQLVFSAWEFEQPCTISTVEFHTFCVPKRSSMQHMVKYLSVTRHKWSTLQRHQQDSGKARHSTSPTTLDQSHSGSGHGRSRVQDRLQLCQLLQARCIVLREPLLNSVGVKCQLVLQQGKRAELNELFCWFALWRG